MPINASPHYERAELEYLNAETTAQKIRCLKKMLALSPKHKGAENLNAQLKRRLAKLKYTKEKEDKSGGRTSSGIKKEEIQAVIVGFTNSGKSTFLKNLTNSSPEIADYKFTTKKAVQGMMDFKNSQIQLVEIPAIDSEYYDKGVVFTADTILAIVNDFEEIDKIKDFLKNNSQKKIFIFPRIERLTEQERRKLKAKLKSNKIEFAFISFKTKEGIEELKEKIFQSFNKIRIYTKQPEQDKEDAKKSKPVILKKDSLVKDVAEKILKGFSRRVKQTRIWGPSSKFSGQKVSLNHKLKDLDIVEFKTT